MIKYVRVRVDEIPKIPPYAKLATDFIGEETETIKFSKIAFHSKLITYLNMIN